MGYYIPDDDLEIKWEKTLTKLPSNEKFGLNNWVKLRTSFEGKDELDAADMRNMVVPDPNNPGKWIAAQGVSEARIMLRMLVNAIVDWSIGDAKTGERWPITEENVARLLKDDFTYLMQEYGEVFQAWQRYLSKPENPKAEPEESEKK